MKIQIKNGYVEMSDVLTRKADRVYNEVLFENAQMDEKGGIKANPQQVDKASEALALALIKKVAVIDGEDEKIVEANQEWLDGLDNVDFKKIDRAAFKIKRESDEQVKKL